MSHELYKKYRPKLLKEIVGQDDAVRVISKLLKSGYPHATLLVGPSGCGKTTIARILRDKLECTEEGYQEMDMTQLRGIDTIRDIRGTMGLSPMTGKSRVWMLDETHRQTGDSQSAMLKILEDTPAHCYFILATTDSSKLLPAIKTRCTTIKLSPINPKVLTALVMSVAAKEKKTISEKVATRIVEAADGSARQALVTLEQVIDLDTEEQQLNAVIRTDTKKNVKDLCQALLGRKQWKDIAAIVNLMDDEPETIRRGILGYMSAVYMNSRNPVAMNCLNLFADHWYDCGKSGLVRCCGEAIR